VNRIRPAATCEPAGRLSRGQIADRLTEMAELLEAQGADRFRVRAYRQGAATVRSLDEAPGRILARGGLKGLTDLPNIGPSLARAIDEMAETGRWMQLERLRGETEPERLFQVLPMVGPGTALFSNTALAHELGRTRDWVVIYFGREGGPEHQRTVVTEARGPLEGRRVVRGREAACREHYFGAV